MCQGVEYGAVGHIGSGGIVMLAAFKRECHPTLRAHVFSGAHAVTDIGLSESHKIA